MKRISTILLATALTLPSFAQLNGNGFYRIQNASSGRYATIVDNKAPKNISDLISKGGNNIQIEAIHTIEGFENIVSDPGSILYIEGNNNKYIIKGQGMDTYSLTQLYLGIHPSRTLEGAYWASGIYQGVEVYLKEGNNKYESFGYYNFATAARNDRQLMICNWYLRPITEADGHYFGLKPEVEAEGKYYTTLCASFAYQLSSGMKAYYVKQCNGQIAELTEIAGNIIPEATPVIIECSSKNSSDNKLTPLSTFSPLSIQNQLKGVYFCNVVKWLMDGEEEHDYPNWNTTNYDSTKMRVLGNVNGKLGFVTADNLKYLPANKAYLPVSTSGSVSAAANIELVDAETYAATSISSITSEKTANEKGIYSLTGNKVNSTENLPAGVYVIDGKKTIIRK